MPQYEVSETFYFRENGQKIIAGQQTVELTEEEAARYDVSHPGLLKAVRKTAQAEPKAVRKDDAPRTRKTR